MAECDFTAGCVGGVAGVIVGHPFDTVKVRLQQQHTGDRLKYTGTLHCFRTIVKNETFFGLYKGLWSPLHGKMFTNGLVFATRGSVIKSIEHRETIAAQTTAGCVAGFVQSLFSAPIELVKVRQQTSLVNKTTLDHYRLIFTHEGGTKGVFRGFTLTVLRDVPSFGIYLASYHWMCRNTSDVTSVFKYLLCGGLAGVLSWIPVHPLDVIKTRQQADGVMGRCKYNGIWDCTMQSYRNEGMAVFFRGMTPTLIRTFPATAMNLTAVTLFMTNICGVDFIK